MQPTTAQDYKQLLTEVIKKQIVILGPDITLSKARNVKGITVADDGTVTNVEGQPQEVIQALIDQFVQLSGLIVKKTMEPLLSMSQSTAPSAPVTPPTAETPVVQGPPPAPAVAEIPSQPTQAAAVTPQPQNPPAVATAQPTPPTQPESPVLSPAKNPLAA